MRYFIWDATRRQWWKGNEHGYTSDLSEAGEFSIKRAVEIMNRSNYGEMDTYIIPIEAAIQCIVGIAESVLETYRNESR